MQRNTLAPFRREPNRSQPIRKISVKISPLLIGVLTLIFLVLKLTHIIDWSWWWIFSPIWLPYAVIYGFFIIVFTLGFVFGILVAILQALASLA